jgi:hypothetical protein
VSLGYEPPPHRGFSAGGGDDLAVVEPTRRRPARVVIDKQTGHEIALKNKHDLFFVPLRYWPPILVCGGVVAMIFG